MRRWQKVSLLGLVGCVGLINGVIWMQARSMTHYVAGKPRLAKAETLAWNDKLKVAVLGFELPRPRNYSTPQNLGLTYETHRMVLSPQDWLEGWFVPHSSARGLVIMFPPYGGSKSYLLKPAKILHDLGYSVFLVDFRGAGGSSGSDTTIGVREAKDVADVVHYAKLHWGDRPLVLYGASMGAAAVLRAVAHEGVTPDGIILESPFDRLLHTVRHRLEVRGLPTFPGAELLVFWGGVQQGIDGFNHNPVDYAKAVRCPTLLMHGAADRLITVDEATAIAQNLAGRKTFISVAKSIGHGAISIRNPTLWRQQTQTFLSSLKEAK